MTMIATLALKEFVPGLIKKIGISDRSFQVMSLIENEIKKTSPEANVVAYKNSKIYVEVDSSVHLFELSLRKREILKILSAVPGLESTELKLFLKGAAKPSAQDRMKSRNRNFIERN